jgi:protein-S-isoprenylcysteine O-methyltransferase Ste14
MRSASTTEPQRSQQDTDWIGRLGGWLFRRRSWLPLPLVLLLVFIPGRRSAPLWIAGAVLVLTGECLRLWGVRHIGVISRTRSDRLGPLVASGPFAYVRNPLYIGNIAVWTGFALSAGLPWLALALVALLAFEYHAIVRWEERLLESRLGETYRAYVSQVPRWLPIGGGSPPGHSVPDGASPFSWGDTLFSERGTLIAIAAGFVLLWSKSL